ncbi:MAG: sugar phosphate isomerase/epimerase [Actinomycetota bacterium]
MRLASAPVTWGVWEKTIGRDDLVPPALLLETMRGLGYTATELGPPGYFSPQLLEQYDMALVGGFAPLRFEDDAGFREDFETWLDPVIEILRATGARGPVVLAGGELAGPHEPPDAAYFDRVERATDRCRSHGVPVVFHHHAGTYVESPAEIEALLAHTDVGICYDTGHALVGGGDPLDVARMCGGRIEHLHLKDVDPAILERVHGGGLSLDAAWGDGLFCGFGEGAVDFDAVLAELAGFAGWTVLEQDRVAVRVADLDAVAAVEASNLEVVERKES